MQPPAVEGLRLETPLPVEESPAPPETSTMDKSADVSLSPVEEEFLLIPNLDETAREQLRDRRRLAADERRALVEVPSEKDLSDTLLVEVNYHEAQAERKLKRNVYIWSVAESLLHLSEALIHLESESTLIPKSIKETRSMTIRQKIADQLLDLLLVEYVFTPEARGFHLTTDGRFLMLGRRHPSRVVIMDLDEDKVVKTLEMPNKGQISLLSSGSNLRTVIAQRTEWDQFLWRMRVWDWQTFSEIPLPEHAIIWASQQIHWGGLHTDRAVDFHGERVLVQMTMPTTRPSLIYSSKIGLFDLHKQQIVSTVDLKRECLNYVFSPTGRHLLVVTDERTTTGITIFDVPSLSPVGKRYLAHSADILGAFKGKGWPYNLPIFSSDGQIARIVNEKKKTVIDAFSGTVRENPKQDPAFSDTVDLLTRGNRIFVDLFTVCHSYIKNDYKRPDPIRVESVVHAFKVEFHQDSQRFLVVCPHKILVLDSALQQEQEFPHAKAGASTVDAIWSFQTNEVVCLLDDGSVGFWNVRTDEWQIVGQHRTGQAMALCEIPETGRIISAYMTPEGMVELKVWEPRSKTAVGQAIRFFPLEKDERHSQNAIPNGIQNRRAMTLSLQDIVPAVDREGRLVVNGLDGDWLVDFVTGTISQLQTETVMEDLIAMKWQSPIPEKQNNSHDTILAEFPYEEGVNCRFVISASGELFAHLTPAPVQGEAKQIQCWIETITAKTEVMEKDRSGFRALVLSEEEWRQKKEELKILGGARPIYYPIWKQGDKETLSR